MVNMGYGSVKSPMGETVKQDLQGSIYQRETTAYHWLDTALKFAGSAGIRYTGGAARFRMRIQFSRPIVPVN